MIKLHAGEIKLVDVKTLKPRPGNRNNHPEEQLKRLADVYKYQGFRNPLIISNQSGNIVCGTGRFLAAKKAGLEKVPVIYQDYESEEQEYAHHVADNGLSLWSELDLAGINADLPDLGPDFDINMLGINNFTLDADIDESKNDLLNIEDSQKNLLLIECEDENTLQNLFSEFQERQLKVTIMS